MQNRRTKAHALLPGKSATNKNNLFIKKNKNKNKNANQSIIEKRIPHSASHPIHTKVGRQKNKQAQSMH